MSRLLGPKSFIRRRPVLATFLMAGSGLAVAASVSEQTRKDIFLIGDQAVRMGRATSAVARILIDYKLSLRGKQEGTQEYENAISAAHTRSAEKLLKVFLDNGGIYIKAGQHVASLSNVLPIEFCSTMTPCQDKAPWRPYREIHDMFIREFGHPPEHYFSEFSHEPFAAASLAQVHKATLKGSSQKMAVKVQYPLLRERCAGDTNTISFLIHVCEKVFPHLKLSWLVEEFEANLPLELNFELEAKNNERTAQLFKKWKNVKTPNIHWPLTNQNVITMEFVDGVKVNDFKGLKAIGASPAKVSQLVTEVFANQLFLTGFVHCDPHPGNLLVRKGPNGRLEMVLLDHGIYREMSDKFRLDYCHLWNAIIMRDEDQMKYYSATMGISDYQLFSSMLTTRAYESSTKGMYGKMTEEEKLIIQKYGQENFANIANILGSVPRQMVLIFKCTDLLRSVQTDLGIPINYFATLAKYATMGINQERSRTNPGLKTWFVNWYSSVALSARLSVYSALMKLSGTSA